MADTSTFLTAGLDEGLLKKISQETTTAQQFWLSGYLYGLATAQETIAQSPLPTTKALTILYGSQTGNSKKVASRAAKVAEAQGWTVQLQDLNDYPTRQLQQEKILLLVVSTQGEGEPPIAAESFYTWLMGARAPKLPDLQFAVCALGDKSYLKYCQTGLDIDERFAGLGAKRLSGCACCDVDYEADAEQWYLQVLGILNQTNQMDTSVPARAKATQEQNTPVFDRNHPLEAPVLEKIQLHGRGAEKETWHFEISLEGSGLRYAPGDALGVYAQNSNALVESVLNAAQLNGDAQLEWEGQSLPFAQILETALELSVLNRSVLQQYQELSGNTELFNLLQNPEQLKNYMWGRNVSDLLHEFPFDLSEQQLMQVLRKLPPRLYSIASSLAFSPEEAHLTVAAVRYHFNQQPRKGVASGFLADEIKAGDKLRVFIEENTYFKLPENDDRDIIMVGPGTGIAPFRAFVQERLERGSSGKNWLFFGNPHFETDFLYQTEWLQHLKGGALDRLDVAFSRDQSDKIYVQHRLLERARLVYERLENGAYFYVCGDKKRMAHDVQQALLEIIQKAGGKSLESAQEYLQTLKKQRRFLEDVY